MAINKVVIKEDGNTRTLIDITDSTVNPETLADGVVAYDKKGEKIAGTLKAEDFYNFDVVGNPQPANPKENTVWVNTDVDITSWIFSATEPSVNKLDLLKDAKTFDEYCTSDGDIIIDNDSEYKLSDYIDVQYGKTYMWNYDISSAISANHYIAEFTSGNVFKAKIKTVASVSGTSFNGTYTPSSPDVVSVRIGWGIAAGKTVDVSFGDSGLVSMLENTTILNGYIKNNGSISSPTSDEQERYIEEYLAVEYGKQYTYKITMSSSKAMWLAIAEYTGNYVFSTRLYPVNYVQGTTASGIYTPSSESVTAIRLTWSSYGDAAATVEFYKPENLAEGNVWFPVGTFSSAEFNALKKNGITVYPMYAKQYIGGAWVDKTAKTYQNGAWVDWWNGELYDYGNEYIDITGGWKGATTSTNYNASGGTFTKNADNIYFKNVASGSFSAVTNKKIDLTGWSTLYLTKKCTAKMSIALYDTYPKSSPLASKSIEGSSGIVEVSMDISSINQPVYVTFGDSMPSGVNIYKVRLER